VRGPACRRPRLLGVVLTIFLPILGVPLTPLPWTLQPDLLIHRIRSDLLPMIIQAALALACGVDTNLLPRMIVVRFEGLPTVAATASIHQAAPDENGRGSFSPEAPINLNVPSQRIHLYQWCRDRFPESSTASSPRCIGPYRCSKRSRLCGVMLPARSTRSFG
jgi:hypothetical protein